MPAKPVNGMTAGPLALVATQQWMCAALALPPVSPLNDITTATVLATSSTVTVALPKAVVTLTGTDCVPESVTL